MENSNTIDFFIQYFLSLKEGNDIYALKHHCLCVIYKLFDKDFNPDYNIQDLYNLQYNYEHFLKNRSNLNFSLVDYLNRDLKIIDLELRIQEIQNKMFMLLAEVLKDYKFSGNFGFT